MAFYSSKEEDYSTKCRPQRSMPWRRRILWRGDHPTRMLLPVMLGASLAAAASLRAAIAILTATSPAAAACRIEALRLIRIFA
jgi:hypothetical protein